LRWGRQLVDAADGFDGERRLIGDRRKWRLGYQLDNDQLDDDQLDDDQLGIGWLVDGRLGRRRNGRLDGKRWIRGKRRRCDRRSRWIRNGRVGRIRRQQG
jgi:hypothetical protein